MVNERQSTREKILSAMYTLVAEKGYDKASIAQVCAMVDITKPALYYYFDSKEELFVELAGSIYPILSSDPKDLESITDAETLRACLTDIGHGIVKNYRRDEERRRFLAEVEIQSARIPALNESLEKKNESIITTFSKILERGIKVGALPKNFDADFTARYLYVFVAGLSEVAAQHSNIQMIDVWDYAIDTMLASPVRKTGK